MIAPIKTALTPSAETLHNQFVDHILPEVTLHAAIQCRRYLKGQDLDDAIQEATAIAWQLSVQAVARGKDPTNFANGIAKFAVRRVKSGRCFAKTSGRDVLSRAAQQRHGFEVHSLDDESCDPGTGWKAAVEQDSKHATPADTVAFRLDFDRWLNERLPQREKRIAERLAIGDRTGEIARKHRLSPGRISKMRHELYESWQRFQGEGA